MRGRLDSGLLGKVCSEGLRALAWLGWCVWQRGPAAKASWQWPSLGAQRQPLQLLLGHFQRRHGQQLGVVQRDAVSQMPISLRNDPEATLCTVPIDMMPIGSGCLLLQMKFLICLEVRGGRRGAPDTVAVLRGRKALAWLARRLLNPAAFASRRARTTSTAPGPPWPAAKKNGLTDSDRLAAVFEEEVGQRCGVVRCCDDSDDVL